MDTKDFLIVILIVVFAILFHVYLLKNSGICYGIAPSTSSSTKFSKEKYTPINMQLDLMNPDAMQSEVGLLPIETDVPTYYSEQTVAQPGSNTFLIDETPQGRA